MNFSFPLPVQTPFVDSKDDRNFSITWERFFKAVSDDLIDATLVKNSKTPGCKYVLNGNICACTYYVIDPVAADVKVALPFPALLAFQAGVSVYPPGTTTVVIPAGSAFEQFWFVAALTQPGQSNI